MKPFFILGVPRSGTTLLAVILNKHSDIYVGDQALTPLFLSLKDSYLKSFLISENISSPSGYERIQKVFHQEKLMTPYKELVNASKPNTIHELFSIIQEDIAKKNEKKMWGDKCPRQINNLTELSFFFPDSKFIHVIRDGRAVALSHKERQYEDLYLAMHDWKRTMLNASIHKSFLGEKRYLEIKYEELLENPEIETEKVCNFLEVKFTPDIINLQANKSTSSGDAYVKNTFDLSKMNTWKLQLKEKEIKKLEKIAGDVLRIQGYQLLYDDGAKSILALSPATVFRKRLSGYFRALFRKKRKVMKDQKIVLVKVSFSARIKVFLKAVIKDTFSEKLINTFSSKKSIF